MTRKKKAVIGLTVAFVATIGIASCGTETEPQADIAVTATDEPTPIETTEPTETPTPTPTEELVETEESVEEPVEEPEATVSQQNALRSAENYISFTPFSKSGLIEQLEYEEFSTADAEWAVNQMDVNWKEQAAKSAENYLDFSGFSRGGLIDQLLYEGFTQEQAEYGVSQVGL